MTPDQAVVEIKRRAVVATPESQIAVFYEDGAFTVTFADTLMTRARINRGDRAFVGTFDSRDSKQDILRAVRAAAKPGPQLGRWNVAKVAFTGSFG